MNHSRHHSSHIYDPLASLTAGRVWIGIPIVTRPDPIEQQSSPDDHHPSSTLRSLSPDLSAILHNQFAYQPHPHLRKRLKSDRHLPRKGYPDIPPPTIYRPYDVSPSLLRLGLPSADSILVSLQRDMKQLASALPPRPSSRSSSSPRSSLPPHIFPEVRWSMVEELRKTLITPVKAQQRVFCSSLCPSSDPDNPLSPVTPLVWEETHSPRLTTHWHLTPGLVPIPGTENLTYYFHPGYRLETPPLIERLS